MVLAYFQFSCSRVFPLAMFLLFTLLSPAGCIVALVSFM